MSPIYPYRCDVCDIETDVVKPMAQSSSREVCECGETMRRIYTMPSVTGTADTFGIGKAFRDEKTGQEINNWKSWEKAGYCDPRDVTNNSRVKSEINRKIEKITKYDAKKRFSVGV